MSFWGNIESWFKKIALNTSWPQTASVVLQLAGPPAILILQETLGPTDAAETASVIHEVQTDLALVSQLLTQVNSGDPSTKGRIVSLLTAMQTNLKALLDDAHIKNSANAAKITTLVDAFLEEITVVLGMIPN